MATEETQHTESWSDRLESESRLGARQASVAADHWPTESDLVEFLSDGNSTSDKDGIGSMTANALSTWFEQRHPENHRQRIENDEAYATEFTTEHGVEDTDEGEFYFGFICPRCGHTNPLTGDPHDFRNRPFACTNCRWVSCLYGDSVKEFAEEAYDGK